MENKKRYVKNALLATTAASLIVTGTGLLGVNATGGGYEFLASESTVGVDGYAATGTDTGMSMDVNQELTGMIEGVNPDELTLEDESFIEELKVLVDKVGKDKVESKILDFLNQSQMKLDELKKVQTPSNLAEGEVKTLTYFEEDLLEIEFLASDDENRNTINAYLIDKYGLSENGNVQIMAYTANPSENPNAEGVLIEIVDNSAWSNPDYQWCRLFENQIYDVEFEYSIKNSEDFIIPNGYQLDPMVKPAVSVMVPSIKILEKKILDSIKVAKGTAFDSIGLPKKIQLKVEGGYELIGLKWEDGNYRPNTKGTRTIIAQPESKKYKYYKSDGETTAPVQVDITVLFKVIVDSYEEVKSSMALGEVAELPEVVTVYQGEEKVIVPVESWHIDEALASEAVTDDYLKSLSVGEHVLYAKLKEASGGTLVINVNPQMILEVVQENVTLENPIEDGIEIELAKISELNSLLPSALSGETNTGKEVEIPVEWSFDKEINQKGVYKATASVKDTNYIINNNVEITLYVYDELDSSYVLPTGSEKYGTDGIEVRENSEYIDIKSGNATHVITIEEGANGNLVVDFTAVEFNDLGNAETPQPIDEGQFKIKIVNNSGKTYSFGEDSLQVSTVVNEGYDYEMLEGTLGFDQQNISKYFARRFNNAALADLLGIPANRQLTEDESNNIVKYLKVKGYEGEGALSHYYLDFYNASSFYNEDGIEATRLEELDKKAIADIFGDEHITPVLETNSELIELYYNIYFNECIGIVFGHEPTHEEKTGEDVSMMIGDYMRGSSYLNAANAYFEKQIDGLAPGESTEVDLYYFVHYYNTHNGFQDTSYKARIAFELEEAPEKPTPTPDPDPTPDPRPEPEEPEEEIEEEETPETGGEEEIEEEPTPETGGEEEEIEDEETPEVGNKDDVTDTGVASTMPWLFGLVTSMGVAIAELFRRRQK